MQHNSNYSDLTGYISTTKLKWEQRWQPACLYLIAIFLCVFLIAGCSQEPAREAESPQPEKQQPAETKPVPEKEKTVSQKTKPIAQVPEVASSQVPNRMMKAREKMKSILLGLMNYYDNHNMFCPDTSITENYATSGRPHLSWRVHILPFMGEDDLFQQFKLNEPWDSPHNQRLLAKMPDVFRAPGDPEDSTTTRFRHVESVLKSPDSRPVTMFPVSPGGASIGFSDMTDQMSETILFLETAPEQATPWTKPDGLPLIPDNPAKAIGLSDPSGTMICFVDGHSSLVKPGTSAEIWSQLLDYADGHSIPDEIFTKFPAPDLEPRTDLPLHLTYMRMPFSDALIVMHPRAMLETGPAKELLTRLSQETDVPDIEKLRDWETVIVWIRRFASGWEGHYLVQYKEPTPRETVLKQLGCDPAHLFSHDDRSWLIAAPSLVAEFAKSRNTPPEGLSLWEDMDLNKNLAMRFYLSSMFEESNVFKYLSNRLDIPVLDQIHTFDLLLDFSGESLLELQVNMKTPEGAVQLRDRIQRFQKQATAELSPLATEADRELSEAMSEHFSMSLITPPWDPQSDKTMLDLKLKQFTSYQRLITSIDEKLIQPAVVKTRAERRQYEQKDQIKLLGLSIYQQQKIMSYQEALAQEEPGGAVVQKEEKNQLSWRVSLLPMIGQYKLYEQFHLDEPWDSLHNLKLLEQMPALYQSAGVTRPGYTSIMTFNGERTPFQDSTSSRLRDASDGLENTILCVQAGADQAVPWTKPVDLPFDPQDPWRVVGKLEYDLLLALMMDGSARWIPRTMPSSEFAKLIDPDDSARKRATSLKWETPTEWTLQVARNLKDPFVRCVILNRIAQAQIAAGEKEQAMQTLKPALEVVYETEQVIISSNRVQESVVKSLLKAGKLESAIQTAKKFTNPMIKVAAYTDVALELIKTEKMKQAAEEIQSLENVHVVKQICGNVAESLVQQGQKQRALEFVEQISLWDHKGSALCAMAWVYYEKDDLQQGLEILKSIEGMYQKVEDETARDQLLSLYAGTLGRGGLYQRPLELIALIKDRDFAQSALEFVAVTLTASGDAKRGLEIVDKIKSPTIKLTALQRISGTIAHKSGDIEQALKVAETIEDPGTREAALEGIARLAAKAGKGKQTEEVMQKLSKLDQNTFFLRDVAYHLVETGNLKSAMQIAELMQTEESKSIFLDSIARAVARSGETKAALDIIQKIQVPMRKDQARSRVAAGFAETGKTDEAIQLVSQIKNGVEQTRVRTEIAAALFKTGDDTQGVKVLNDAIDFASKHRARNYLVDVIMPLASEPLTAAQQKETDKDIVTPLKKSFTPDEKRVAKRLMKALQSR
ncbi:Anaphase-promoting complex, cyclosome, subunit 3 [Gimesia maris]|nr:Anaphase-promoting complex, cyclosome, subunit 3 [Gimesia maris]